MKLLNAFGENNIRTFGRAAVTITELFNAEVISKSLTDVHRGYSTIN